MNLNLPKETQDLLCQQAKLMGMMPADHVREMAIAEQERLETLASVRRGLADIDAGRVQPIEEMFREIEERYPNLRDR